MAVLSGKITKSKLRTLGPGRHADGNGLYLLVEPSGSKRWIARLTIRGKQNKNGGPLRTDFGLGSLSLVGIDQARELALEYRRKAIEGIDPRPRSASKQVTFEELARKVHKDRLPTWKNKVHAAQWINTLRDYAFPMIGSMSVEDIGQPEVLSCLSPIWTSKYETARRVAQRIKTVLDVAKAQELRTADNPVSTILNAKVLPQVKSRAEHHAALSWKLAPALYSHLRADQSDAASALRFLTLTASRTSEVLGATWKEIDFDQKVWVVPSSRMKAGVEHRVPLTAACVDVLEDMKARNDHFLFEGRSRNKPLSNMAMSMVLRRSPFKGVTVHGLRSTFRDWAAEATDFSPDLAEMCLAHSVGSKVERAYNRAQRLEQRQQLLHDWSLWLQQS